jgi:hypothetical protein
VSDNNNDQLLSICKTELDLIIAIIGILFVFQGFLIDIDENSILFERMGDQLFYYYGISLKEGMLSFMLLSFLNLIIALFILLLIKYVKESELKNQIYDEDMDRGRRFIYRVFMIMGVYFFIVLFMCIWFMLDLKYFENIHRILFSYYVWIIILLPYVLQGYLFNILFPFGKKGVNLGYLLIYMCYVEYIGIFWHRIDFNKYISLFTPGHLHFGNFFLFLTAIFIIFNTADYIKRKYQSTSL